MTPPRLVLDFDGVVCDALSECALVTWLGVHPPHPASAVSSHAGAMPRGFTQRFRVVRNYARTLEHFLVAHRPGAAHIRTRARFEMIFACLAPSFTAAFSSAATSARRRCRTEEPRYWLDLHVFYPGITDLLREHAGAIAVVTAKDEPSVRAILTRHGLGHTVGDVIGECRDKAGAVRAICRRHDTDPRSVLFLDDNVGNVRQVAQSGADARWAAWGYHTREDVDDLARLRIPRVELADLPTLIPA